MNLQNWISQARKSWQEHNPKMYRELYLSRHLMSALEDAAERTHLEMTELEQAGYSNQEAWEMTREKYLFLPPESQQEEEPSAATSLFKQANDLKNQILQSDSQEISLS